MAAKLKLALRKKWEAQREEKINSTFTSTNKELEEAKRARHNKKKSADELLGHLFLTQITKGWMIREPQAYVSRSHNLDRQLQDLINHLFVKYRVPRSLYCVFTPDANDPFHQFADIYQHWFVTIAQGGSFTKLVKGVMTSREACCFLKAPRLRPIHENVWWAKLTVLDIPEKLTDVLIEWVFKHHFYDDPDGRLAEALLFFEKQACGIASKDLAETLDYISYQLLNDKAFRLKGRTAASVLKLANERNMLIRRAKLGQYVSWAGLGLPDWNDFSESGITTVAELSNNRMLISEGRKLHHCVYDYVDWCTKGYSSIFSMHTYESMLSDHSDNSMKSLFIKGRERSHLTIEVSAKRRSIVQIRGTLNRWPNIGEMNIIQRWAGRFGFTIPGIYMEV